MTKEKIIEYVLTTPHNPNRAVLSDMLETYLADNGGGGGDTPGPEPDPDKDYIYDGGGVSGW